MAVRVLAATGMDGQRIRQALGTGQVLGELGRQRLLLVEGQLDRQGKFDLLEQPPIGAFIQVGSIPVVGGALGPLGQVAGLSVQHLVTVAGVTALPLDVIGFRLGRLAAVPAAGLGRKVIDGHRGLAPCNGPRRAHSPKGVPAGQFLEEKPVSAPSRQNDGRGLRRMCSDDSIMAST